MCGIAGYIGNRPPSAKRIAASLRAIEHRGPDADGCYQKELPNGQHVTLLHRRLSIIDLDPRSTQPFCNNEQVLCYNGELYNYVELKRQLGGAWRTDSDTEVLLRQLESNGIDGLDACEGMWAFAWLDERRGRLVLSRDRFGEKPLYLRRTEHGLYFASEPKAIAALSGEPLEANKSQLLRFMVNGYRSIYKTSDSFLEGIDELPPACNLIVDSQGREHQVTYWNPKVQQQKSMTYESAVEGVRHRLIESVKLRLRADVPIAFCMSGGIDSNSLICTAKKVLGYDVHGFTIANTDSRYEEMEEVTQVVQQLDLRHSEIPVSTENFIENLSQLVRHHDAPVYTISYYAHWTLMQQIQKHGYKISVSGTAADELFTGYYDHHMFYLSAISQDHNAYREAAANWAEHVKPVVRNPFLQDPQRFVEDPEFRDHLYLNCDVFSGMMNSPWQESFVESCFTEDVLRNRMLNELFYEATRVILHEDDLNAMFYSIENRSPFLDRELCEFAASIPTHLLIRNGAAKSVLRDAMRDIVPDAILDNRRKVGFNAPIFDYLDPKSSTTREFLLSESPIYDLVRREAIEQMLSRPTLANSESKFLFSFINCKIFLEHTSA